MPVPCQHCKEAPCIEGCPTGASYRTEDGIVLVDQNKCVGCKFCMVVCPYECRVFNRETGVVQKCVLCTERLHYVTAKGKSKPKPPRCVEVCHMKCRYYGDLDDPNSEISQMIKFFNAKPLKEEAGTQPSMYYIFPDETNKI
jgi:Fe-S-cluster-containing dehydrogenase component